MPVALTLNVAVAPSTALWLAGPLNWVARGVTVRLSPSGVSSAMTWDSGRLPSAVHPVMRSADGFIHDT